LTVPREPDKVALSELATLFTAARAALFAQNIEEREPELALTVAAIIESLSVCGPETRAAARLAYTTMCARWSGRADAGRADDYRIPRCSSRLAGILAQLTKRHRRRLDPPGVTPEACTDCNPGERATARRCHGGGRIRPRQARELRTRSSNT
jgi:hypothetical protein